MYFFKPIEGYREVSMTAILVLEPDGADRETIAYALADAGFVPQAFGERKRALAALQSEPNVYKLIIADDESFFAEIGKDPAFDDVPKVSLGKGTRRDPKRLVETVVSALKNTA